jgi:hypothetical protein
MLAAILKQNHSQGPHSGCFFNVCAHLSLKYSIFLLSLSGCPILSMMGGSILVSSGVLGDLPSSQGGLFEPGGNSQKYFRNDFIHCIQSTKMTVFPGSFWEFITGNLVQNIIFLALKAAFCVLVVI